MYTTRWQRRTPFGYGLCVQSCSRHFISDTTQMHLHIIAYALREYRVFRPSPEFWRRAGGHAGLSVETAVLTRLYDYNFISDRSIRRSAGVRQSIGKRRTIERPSEYRAGIILSTSRNTVYARAACFYG